MCGYLFLLQNYIIIINIIFILRNKTIFIMKYDKYYSNEFSTKLYFFSNTNCIVYISNNLCVKNCYPCMLEAHKKQLQINQIPPT